MGADDSKKIAGPPQVLDYSRPERREIGTFLWTLLLSLLVVLLGGGFLVYGVFVLEMGLVEDLTGLAVVGVVLVIYGAWALFVSIPGVIRSIRFSRRRDD